jgi:hypothetical protein
MKIKAYIARVDFSSGKKFISKNGALSSRPNDTTFLFNSFEGGYKAAQKAFRNGCDFNIDISEYELTIRGMR